MEQYISKDALVTEIKRLHKEHSSKYECDEAALVLEDLEDFLETLEVKEVDLWTELSNYIEHYRNRETGYTLFGIAKHFFELGLRAQKGE